MDDGHILTCFILNSSHQIRFFLKSGHTRIRFFLKSGGWPRPRRREANERRPELVREVGNDESTGQVGGSASVDEAGGREPHGTRRSG
jgi:hypothetical protein